LWEAILDFVGDEGPVQRADILERFRNDGEVAVIAVLTDLASSGLVYSSGRGEGAIYGITSDADRKALSNEDAVDVLSLLLWGTVFRTPGMTVADLLATTRASDAQTRAAIDRLLSDGRVTREGEGDEAKLRSASFVISVGDPQGWEAAVFDHFQALCNGVATKLRERAVGNGSSDVVGGTTVHFGIHPGHPHEAEVLGTLRRVRGELAALLKKVSTHNREYGVVAETATRVTFYFGQSVMPPSEPDLAEALDADGSNMSGSRANP